MPISGGRHRINVCCKFLSLTRDCLCSLSFSGSTIYYRFVCRNRLKIGGSCRCERQTRVEFSIINPNENIVAFLLNRIFGFIFYLFWLQHNDIYIYLLPFSVIFLSYLIWNKFKFSIFPYRTVDENVLAVPVDADCRMIECAARHNRWPFYARTIN